MLSENDLLRFKSCYKQVGDCKLWEKYLDKDGYGKFYLFKKNRRAHRVSYYIANGNIPDNMVIDHICKNRNCVEPSHLRCVTKRENTLNNSLSVGAINSRRIHCKNGHLFDRKYGKQRYCSVCQSEKMKYLYQKWKELANTMKC